MTASATATCYRQVSGFIQPESGWVICPSSYQGLCCEQGSDCLDEQICHNTKDSSPGGSGYYIGLCTDATYKSSSCSSRCTDDEWGDVAYNSNTSLWACCGTNESCDNPTNETFLAPPPQQLLAAASSQSASRATAASSSLQSRTTAASNSITSATVTVTSTPSATAVDQTTSSSLTGGAKAGIGVGAAVAAVAIIALFVWVILLRRRLRERGQARDSMGRRAENMTDEGWRKEAREIVVREHELSGHGLTHEMEGR